MPVTNQPITLAELAQLSASLVNAAEAVNKVQPVGAHTVSDDSELGTARFDAAIAINDAATKIAKAIGVLVGDETDA